MFAKTSIFHCNITMSSKKQYYWVSSCIRWSKVE